MISEFPYKREWETLYMELLIKIGDVKLTATEIDILHIILDTERYDWTIGSIASCLPATYEDIWRDVQSLILHGLLERTNMSQSFENIKVISVTVPLTAQSWLSQNAQDIEDAFVILNPDMFELTEVGEA